MKSILRSFTLFFILSLNISTFAMNKDNAFTVPNSTNIIFSGLMTTDLLFNTEGSWIRTGGTLLAVGIATVIDKDITVSSGENSNLFTNLTLAGVVGLHASRVVSYFSQANEQRNFNNGLSELQKRVTALEQNQYIILQGIDRIAQIIPQQNQQ